MHSIRVTNKNRNISYSLFIIFISVIFLSSQPLKAKQLETAIPIHNLIERSEETHEILCSLVKKVSGGGKSEFHKSRNVAALRIGNSEIIVDVSGIRPVPKEKLKNREKDTFQPIIYDVCRVLLGGKNEKIIRDILNDKDEYKDEEKVEALNQYLAGISNYLRFLSQFFEGYVKKDTIDEAIKSLETNKIKDEKGIEGLIEKLKTGFVGEKFSGSLNDFLHSETLLAYMVYNKETMEPNKTIHITSMRDMCPICEHVWYRIANKTLPKSLLEESSPFLLIDPKNGVFVSSQEPFGQKARPKDKPHFKSQDYTGKETGLFKVAFTSKCKIAQPDKKQESIPEQKEEKTEKKKEETKNL